MFKPSSSAARLLTETAYATEVRNGLPYADINERRDEPLQTVRTNTPKRNDVLILVHEQTELHAE
jgi:hypothetical protein